MVILKMLFVCNKGHLNFYSFLPTETLSNPDLKVTKLNEGETGIGHHRYMTPSIHSHENS